LDAGRLREAALQLRIALEAALVELPGASGATAGMATRIEELRERAPAVAALAADALTSELPETRSASLTETLQRLEAALRAHVAATD
ncbi:MAG: hypothetical protein ACTHOE_00635, partial [Conexibacter sp.]